MNKEDKIVTRSHLVLDAIFNYLNSGSVLLNGGIKVFASWINYNLVYIVYEKNLIPGIHGLEINVNAPAPTGDYPCSPQDLGIEIVMLKICEPGEGVPIEYIKKGRIWWNAENIQNLPKTVGEALEYAKN
ncbi:MAG: hypothetical protein ACRCSF_01730 [Mycobacteriaceae bacterium]